MGSYPLTRFSVVASVPVNDTSKSLVLSLGTSTVFHVFVTTNQRLGKAGIVPNEWQWFWRGQNALYFEIPHSDPRFCHALISDCIYYINVTYFSTSAFRNPNPFIPSRFSLSLRFSPSPISFGVQTARGSATSVTEYIARGQEMWFVFTYQVSLRIVEFDVVVNKTVGGFINGQRGTAAGRGGIDVYIVRKEENSQLEPILDPIDNTYKYARPPLLSPTFAFSPSSFDWSLSESTQFIPPLPVSWFSSSVNYLSTEAPKINRVYN